MISIYLRDILESYPNIDLTTRYAVGFYSPFTVLTLLQSLINFLHIIFVSSASINAEIILEKLTLSCSSAKMWNIFRKYSKNVNIDLVIKPINNFLKSSDRGDLLSNLT